MTTTPVISIDVDDSAFQRFAAAFDDYGEALKKMPAEWDALNGRINEAAKLHKSVGASMDTAWASATSAAAAYEATVHGAAKAQAGLAATTTRSGNAMHHMATQAKAVRDHLFGAVRFLAKFSAYGIGGGLLGVGGLAFGLDDIASGVTATRRTSRGYGLTTGQYNSFMANMKPYAGASALEGAANVRSGDPNAAVNIGVLGIGGINAQRMNSAQLVAAELIAVHRDNKAQPGKNTAWWAAANAQGLSDDQIRVAIATKMSTLQAARDTMNQDSSSMGYTGKVAAAWQAFDIQLAKAKIQIGSAFISGLAPIMPQLTTLSREFSGFIVGLEKSGEVKRWVGDLEVGLKEFGAWLKTPAFKNDLAWAEKKVKEFGHAADIVANDVISVSKWIEAHEPKSLKTEIKDAGKGVVAGAKRWWDSYGSAPKADVDAATKKYADRFHVPLAVARGIAWNESSYGQHLYNAKNGDAGVMQVLPSNWKALGIKDPYNTNQDVRGGLRYAEEMHKKYGSWSKAVAAYTWGPGNLDKDIAANGSNWFAKMPLDKQNYVRGIMWGESAHKAAMMAPALHPTPLQSAGDWLHKTYVAPWTVPPTRPASSAAGLSLWSPPAHSPPSAPAGFGADLMKHLRKLKAPSTQHIVVTAPPGSRVWYGLGAAAGNG